jgi:hypothetical protein
VHGSFGGVVPTVFWGKKYCQGREELYLLDFSQFLDPDDGSAKG